jgi:predicted RNase H-like HicB family nuclease
MSAQAVYYHESMLRYHVAFHLPRSSGDMVVAEALDFPGAVTQGFDLQDARLMIASALEDLAQLLLEEGQPLPRPSKGAQDVEADLIELVPLSIHAGTMSR